MSVTAITLPHSRLPVSAEAKPCSRDKLAASFASGAVHLVPVRGHVFRFGDPAAHVYRIEAGDVCLYRMMPDGRRHVIDFAFPGDLIGLESLEAYTASAVAISPTRVRRLSRSELDRRILGEPELALKVVEVMARDTETARQNAFTISRRSASERLAGFLLSMARRYELKGAPADSFVLPMSRTDIADYLGLTIETVSRTFTRFREDGLIDVSQCVLVTIRDPKGLKEVADTGSRHEGATADVVKLRSREAAEGAPQASAGSW